MINEISEETKNEIKQNLIEYFTFFDANTPDNKVLDGNDLIYNFQNIASSRKSKCPLLINNKCSIYESRPLACRIHIVEDYPTLCEQKPYRDSSKPAMFARQQLLNFITTKQKTFIAPLSYIIAEALLPEKKLKPIEKLFIN